MKVDVVFTVVASQKHQFTTYSLYDGCKEFDLIEIRVQIGMSTAISHICGVATTSELPKIMGS